jgi:hypothetical protein
VETEKLFNEVRKIYFDKLKNNKGGNLIGR